MKYKSRRSEATHLRVEFLGEENVSDEPTDMGRDRPHLRVPRLDARNLLDEHVLERLEDVLDVLGVSSPLVCCQPLLLGEERREELDVRRGLGGIDHALEADVFAVEI